MTVTSSYMYVPICIYVALNIKIYTYVLYKISNATDVLVLRHCTYNIKGEHYLAHP